MCFLTLLDLIIKEYISIVDVLKITESVENSRIILEREHFKNLLEKYKYMNFSDKVKVYKDLNLIIHDKNNYTMPCKDTEMKKTVRKVVINYSTYETVKKLYETNVS